MPAVRSGGIVSLMVLVAGLLAVPARGEALPVAPAAYRQVVKSGGKAIACPALPAPFTGPLAFASKYQGSGRARDVVNPEAEASYAAATAPIRQFESAAAALTDAYMRSGDADDLACLLRLMESWAGAHALEGAADNYAGKSIRKWALATAAGSYLRLAQSDSGPLRNHAKEDAAIRAWLIRLASQVMAEWDLSAPPAKINNQTYWAGWSVMAVGVLAGRSDFFEWGWRAYERGLEQIDGDGYLPRELARGTRALAYHNYALQPLTMLAVFARANGVDSQYPGALARLAQRTLSGIDDPRIFAARTGVAQDVAGLSSPQALVWLEALCWQGACTPPETAKLVASRPLHANRLGGSMTALFAP